MTLPIATDHPIASDADTTIVSPAVAEARRQVSMRSRMRVFEPLVWVAAVLAFFLLPARMLLLTEIAITALFALSLDLVLGYAGVISLGHAAFFGIGAYTAGLMSLHLVSEPVTGLVIAALVSAAAGFLASFLLLRGSDLTRLMTTLGVGMMVAEAANQMSWLTGGADGLTGFSLGPVLGLFEFDLWGRTGYVYTLVVLFLAVMLCRRIVYSPFGLSLRAIRDNPVRAGMIAVPATRRIVMIYTLSAGLAGMAGALLTQTTSFVSLDVLAFHRSADVLLVLVIGGTGYLYGGIFGAIAFILIRDLVSVVTPQYWMFWIGLLLVALVLFGRQRLSGLFQLGRLRRLRKADPP